MAKVARDYALLAVFQSFFGIGSRLPLRLTRRLGPAFGALVLRAIPKERRRMQRHIATAFPDFSDEQRVALINGCARHFGLMFSEVAWLWRAAPQAIEGLCEISGLEHFENALAQGRGVMMTTGHTGNWEMIAARLPIAGFPLVSAVREQKNPRADAIINRLRTKHGTEVVHRGESAGRRLVGALQKNRIVALLIDQDIRDIPGVFVPFFGQPAWTPSGAALLALRAQCPVIPGFIHRQPDMSHRLELQPPIEPSGHGSIEDQVLEVTAAATSAIENQIRKHPEQWVWMHRRWRTRPKDEA